MKRIGALVLALGLLGATAGGTAEAQTSTTDAPGDVPSLIRDDVDRASSVPLPWELPGLRFPILDHDRSIAATSEDNAQLRFLDGTELGSFRPANPGGSPFFGSGQPIFGMAAPPVLPSRILRPLGAGDAGDRFLGQRPPVDPRTVIPKLDETFDRSRESFAFLGGVPAVPDVVSSGSLPFPLADAVIADPTPGCPDNLLSCRPAPPPVVTTAPPTTSVAPVATPRPPVTVTVPTSTPRPSVPPTIPPAGTTTTAPPTTVPRATTTTQPRSTTTLVPTTTTLVPTTTSTPTTTVVPSPPTSTPSAMFVLGNQVEADADPDSVSAVTRDLCLSNVQPSNANPDCDRLFAFGEGPGRRGFMRLGHQYFVNLTLWNVQDVSTIDATDLRVYAPDACRSTPTPAASSDSLCKAIQLKIQRYADPARSDPVECVYGGGAGGNTCLWSSTKTLAAFGGTHTSMASGAPIGAAFPVSRKAYLRIYVRLPDTGVDASGFGNDNRYIDQRADLRFRWQMQSG